MQASQEGAQGQDITLLAPSASDDAEAVCGEAEMVGDVHVAAHVLALGEDAICEVSDGFAVDLAVQGEALSCLPPSKHLILPFGGLK